MNAGSTGTEVPEKFRFKITICHRLNVCWAYPLMLHLIPLINCWITWSGRKKNMPETEKIRVCVSTWQTRSVTSGQRKMKSDVCEQLWSEVSWRGSSCFRLQEVSLPPGSFLVVVFSYFVGYIQRTFPREEARIHLLLGEAGSRQLELLFPYVAVHFGLIIAVIPPKLTTLNAISFWDKCGSVCQSHWRGVKRTSTPNFSHLYSDWLTFTLHFWKWT